MKRGNIAKTYDTSSLSTCAGKVGFESGCHARTALRHRRDGHEARHIYRCRFCRRWHVGTFAATVENAKREQRNQRKAKRVADSIDAAEW